MSGKKRKSRLTGALMALLGAACALKKDVKTAAEAA